MLKTIIVALLSFNMLFGNGSGNLMTEQNKSRAANDTGTLEKLIVSNGTVDVDLFGDRVGWLTMGQGPAGAQSASTPTPTG